jgi:hypothetical protein
MEVGFESYKAFQIAFRRSKENVHGKMAPVTENKNR